jgi:hypothetical protein
MIICEIKRFHNLLLVFGNNTILIHKLNLRILYNRHTGMDFSKIYVRNSEYPNKSSIALLTPKDVRTLTQYGFAVFIEMSETRIFPDDEYLDSGGILTIEPWYSQLHHDCLIIGWSPPVEFDKLYQHSHLCVSNRATEECLSKFENTQSSLYFCETVLQSDLSHYTNAGYVATSLGLSHLYARRVEQRTLGEVGQWKTKEALLKLLTYYFRDWKTNTIGILDNHSQYGKGVMSMLNDLKMEYTHIEKSKIDTIRQFDIVFICNNEYPECTKDYLDTIYHKERKHSVWIDVSGEITKHLHSLCPRHSTIYKPVLEICDTLDIIALDNYNLLFPEITSIDVSTMILNIVTSITPLQKDV